MPRNSIFRTVALLVVMLAAFAAVALAGDGKEAKMSETISVWGGNTPVLGSSAVDVAGLRYQFNVPIGQSHHWVAAPAVGYGYGRYKTDLTSSGTTASTTYSRSMWDAMLDFLYYNDCCDDDDFYCGPGFFYSSNTPKVDPNPSNLTFDPFNTFGVQMTVGGGIPVGQKMEVVGSLSERFGMTMYDQKDTSGETKLSGTTYSTLFTGGVRIKF